MPAWARVVRGDVLDLAPENFDTVMGVNLRGTLFFTTACVREMLRLGDQGAARSVITISSVSAEMASPERTDYCISKAGLAMAMKNFALRLAPEGIGVFEIRPGIIRTPMTAAVAPNMTPASRRASCLPCAGASRRTSPPWWRRSPPAGSASPPAA